jgi:hypothetical protein
VVKSSIASHVTDVPCTPDNIGRLHLIQSHRLFTFLLWWWLWKWDILYVLTQALSDRLLEADLWLGGLMPTV